jgi:hypothetical protein
MITRVRGNNSKRPHTNPFKNRANPQTIRNPLGSKYVTPLCDGKTLGARYLTANVLLVTQKNAITLKSSVVSIYTLTTFTKQSIRHKTLQLNIDIAGF